MPLMSIKNELLKAKAAQYAVPMIDVFDMAGVEGVFAALEEKQAPMMLAIYAQFLDMPNGKAFAAYIRTRAENIHSPISLILDHGSSFEQCMRAISYGFPDVMFDGSNLSFEENMAITRQVVQAGHAFGVSVEAELGHVGSGDQYDVYGAQRVGFTNPALVARFVEETGVDALAVAFGNAHGLYKGEPHLDFQLLAEIRRQVEIPLVMHGGTGLSDEQFRAAIQAGINKINVATIMIHTAARQMAEASQAKNASLFTINEAARQAYFQCSSHVCDVFGATGKV
jgi:fructose-bisphosphate aldolase class II